MGVNYIGISANFRFWSTSHEHVFDKRKYNLDRHDSTWFRSVQSDSWKSWHWQHSIETIVTVGFYWCRIGNRQNAHHAHHFRWPCQKHWNHAAHSGYCLRATFAVKYVRCLLCRCTQILSILWLFRPDRQMRNIRLDNLMVVLHDSHDLQRNRWHCWIQTMLTNIETAVPLLLYCQSKGFRRQPTRVRNLPAPFDRSARFDSLSILSLLLIRWFFACIAATIACFPFLRCTCLANRHPSTNNVDIRDHQDGISMRRANTQNQLEMPLKFQLQQ